MIKTYRKIAQFQPNSLMGRINKSRNMEFVHRIHRRLEQ